jgi:hypothetical protein
MAWMHSHECGNIKAWVRLETWGEGDERSSTLQGRSSRPFVKAVRQGHSSGPDLIHINVSAICCISRSSELDRREKQQQRGAGKSTHFQELVKWGLQTNGLPAETRRHRPNPVHARAQKKSAPERALLESEAFSWNTPLFGRTRYRHDAKWHDRKNEPVRKGQGNNHPLARPF